MLQQIKFVGNSNKNSPLRNVHQYIFPTLCNSLHSKNSNYMICDIAKQTLTSVKTFSVHLEDVFLNIFRKLLEDVLKTNMFALVIPPQKTSLWRLQDILIKTNIFVLVIRLQHTSKTFSRSFQDVFKTFCQYVVKTYSRHLQDALRFRFIIKLRCFC